MPIVSLTEEQYEKTRKFIQDQRSTFMAAYYAAIGGAILLLFPALLDLLRLRVGSIRTRRVGSLLFCWGVCVIQIVVYLFMGLGKIFGPRSDYDRICRSDYGCQYFTVKAKDENKNKHPYFVTDAQGFDYMCVSFLDYKYAEAGTEMIGITLGNGKRYAMQLFDATDPYARMEY